MQICRGIKRVSIKTIKIWKYLKVDQFPVVLDRGKINNCDCTDQVTKVRY